ncbi:transcriptional regulator [Streptomyces venezuelae]|uniref:Transcriptional regulator n=1 Tax=Streptomyces venezuelae TaxID=54571 RepID=A0A5P2CM53_STRVZ|nr:helix-turn-helix transcriptional regulator [Streptomyces venezuelae]QES42798.1 transcriptional regulator [Streptomyces venezuelae]
MPARIQPTARQRRLGAELRKLRESAGLSSGEAAGLLGVKQAQMSQFEAGNAGINEERVRRLAAHYACADAELIACLADMATDTTRGWWESFRGVLPPAFLDLAELEHHAHFMHVIGTAQVPGLLQTADYARAVFAFWRPELPASELAPRVEHRLRRAAVLNREEPAPYIAVLHESVLQTRVADRGVSRTQLREILRKSEMPNVTVRVVPFDVDGFAGAGTTLFYAGGPVAALDTVQRDAPYGSSFIDADAQLLAMRTLFRKVEAMALEPGPSQDLIHRLLKEL